VTEIKDTKGQTWTFEIDWARKQSPPKSRKEPYDFGKAIAQRISDTSRTAFDTEIKKYQDTGWWLPTQSEPEPNQPPAVICFPLEQGEHKSTKARPVLDCRRYNEDLGKFFAN